jgi:hypothetical protein
MSNKLFFAILFSFSFLFIEAVRAQNGIDSTFRRLFKNISGYYGNVFLDTSYLKVDTSYLRKMYPTELTNELNLVSIYKMSLADFSFSNLYQLSNKFRTKKEFYDERKNSNITLSNEDSTILAKEDSFHANPSKYVMNENVYDSLQKVENMLLESTFDRIFSDRRAKNQPKYMTLLAIFETDKMYLFIYHFMMLQGYPHYYVKSDLILK